MYCDLESQVRKQCQVDVKNTLYLVYKDARPIQKLQVLCGESWDRVRGELGHVPSLPKEAVPTLPKGMGFTNKCIVIASLVSRLG